MNSLIRSHLYIVIFLGSVLAVNSANAAGPTIVSTSIATSTTWTVAESPYVITGSFYVPANTTLTIEPGVIVKIAANPSYVMVLGSIITKGTDASPVIFTSYKDDAHGGDSNNDEPENSPQPGDWTGIIFAENSNSTIMHTQILYGGARLAISFGSMADSAISVQGGNLQLAYSRVTQSANSGIAMNYGNLAVTECEIDLSQGAGIRISGGIAAISNSDIHHNALYGVDVIGGQITLSENEFRNNTAGAISADISVPMVHNGNTATGNGWNAIVVRNGTIRDVTLVASDLPYVITDTLYVSVNTTLTLEPGVIFKVAQYPAHIEVFGSLMASGIASAPVILTSYKDDAHGGDTNNDGPENFPQAGDWASVIFYAGSNSNLLHTQALYGGSNLRISFGAMSESTLAVQGGTVYMDRGRITQSAGAGIEMNYGQLYVNDSEINNSNSSGIKVLGGLAAINGSDIHHHLGNGIFISGGQPEITGNTFHDIAGSAIYSAMSAQVSLNDNSAVNNGINGVTVSGGTSQDVIWYDDLPYFIPENVYISGGTMLTLRPGVVVKFSSAQTYMRVFGSLVGQGTKTEPVIITSFADDAHGGDISNENPETSPLTGDWGTIMFEPGSTSTLIGTQSYFGGRYFPISFEGFFHASYTVQGGNLTLLDSRVSQSGNRGIEVKGGTLTVKGSEIDTSGSNGIYVPGGTVNISRSNIHDNGSYGVFAVTPTQVDARNNYWGDPSGPFNNPWNTTGLGNAVSANVDFIPFLTADPLVAVERIPVILIPGIAGTELYNGDDLIWPDLKQMAEDTNDQFLTENLNLDDNGNSILSISEKNIVTKIVLPYLPITVLDIFDGLIDDFISHGYTTTTNLFFFPYDWRLNLDNANDLLNQKIEIVKAQTGSSKVNIIAHSMGGLLTKNYINQYGKGSIDKLIFVGTPHIGAPKAAKILLEGDQLDIYWLEEDRIKEIAENSPAVYELLPNPTYFTNYSGYIQQIGPIYDYNQTKEFLLEKELNSNVFGRAEAFFTKNLQDMDFAGIDAYNIAGCKLATQAAYQFNIIGNIVRTGYVGGDATVPIGSADHISVPSLKKYYSKKGTHSELPSIEDVRNAIFAILSAEPVVTTNNFKNDTTFCYIQGKTVTWKSPVEVHIYDTENRHAGPIGNNAMEHEIPGVNYDIIGHQKFIFLPTDEGQTYRIEAQGTDQGTFDLRISENDNGTTINTNVFNDIPVNISTRIQFNVSAVTTDDVIEVDQGNNDPEIVKADAELPGAQGDDVASPETTVNITGEAGWTKWFKSDVQITLAAADESSGILETRYSFDGGSTYVTYNAPISVTSEGVMALKYFSVDKAGNNEQVKSLELKIDKNNPEIEASFDRNSKSFIFTVSDNQDKNPVIICTQERCTANDMAGNITILNFQKYKLQSQYLLDMKSIEYNNIAMQFPENVIIVKFDEKNGLLNEQVLLVHKQEVLRINYNRTKNESTVTSFKNSVYSKEIVGGMKILQLITENGKIISAIN